MTILDRLRRTAAGRGLADGIRFESRRFTFADLEGGSNAAARVFRSHGVRPGERVVLCAGTSLEWVLAYLGALKLGAVAVPVNPAYRSGELDWILADAEPAVIVCDRDGLALAAGSAPPSVRALLEIERGTGERAAGGPRVFPFYQALRKASVHPVDELVENDAPALIVYTSGTTGRAKGAMLTHGNLEANAAALVQAFRWTAEDRFLHVLPLHHVHGLCVGLNGTLLAGCETRLLPRFDADLVLCALRDERTTLFMGVPTMYTRLLQAAAGDRPELPALRLCVSGSAPLHPRTAERFEEVFGQRILERYGMTETLITAVQDHDGPRTPGTVGRPLPGVQVRIVDSDLNDVPTGAEGELLVKGPGVGPGYWRNPAATEAAFAGGWFLTGDLARRDEDGVLAIVGRAREVILTGGYNVYPREVEEVLAEHPDVAEVAVYGVADDDLGEAVAAVVVPRPGATPDAAALVAHCRERLASYKKPRHVRFATELPRNAMGKVLKDRLAAEGPG